MHRTTWIGFCFAIGLALIATTGCCLDQKPGKTIFGTPVHHWVVAINKGDDNVQWFVSDIPYVTLPDDVEWIDINAQSSGYVGRASLYLESGDYYEWARVTSTRRVYIAKRKFHVSDVDGDTFEGNPAGLVLNVTP